MKSNITKKIALIYHGVLRWPEGIYTQLEQLVGHDVDIFFCLQKDKDSSEIISQFDYKHSELYDRPTYDWFCETLEMDKLKKIRNQNWLSYAPFLSRSFSLLNYHNFLMIQEKFEKIYSTYDIVIISHSSLRGLFPFDFSNFDNDHLYVSDYFSWGGYQMIGNWFYGSPQIISKSLKSTYKTLFETNLLLSWKPEIYNAECYSKFAVDNVNIPVKNYPLNAFTSADTAKVEQSGWGSLKWSDKHNVYFKYTGQLKGALTNLDLYNKNKL